MILVFRSIKNKVYADIVAGVPRGRALNDSGVVEERNFRRLLLAICSNTLDRMCRIKAYIQDIEPFDGFSWSPNA